MVFATVFNNANLGIIGFILSAYSVYVEHKVESQNDDPGGEEFHALCDIEAIGASCSAVFSLPEGKMLSYFGIVPEGHFLDIPNGILGMIYYSYTILGYFLKKNMSAVGGGTFSLLFAPMMNLVISSLAMASSAFLARKLYILRELCVVCVTTHIINMTLWIRAFSTYREGLVVDRRSKRVKST